ncbi:MULTISPECIES: XRE family transcriptional regulator [Actinokineospora]|uniref:Uncharacterized protein n=1 Tax=Actinokineospora fastidiosa TaxID=1816 RepID=A0A918GG62_9PSEU|nr:MULTISPECIES: XRE family transcriptional regulator [Actinokineospora]UVS80188.1 hypothetical protein Actkin_03938 [Actinokineospora sp. UTMC 2448]GGS33594.1 hypothetical protein GCM10010171_29800 [Actinokineospora fastidiosa]
MNADQPLRFADVLRSAVRERGVPLDRIADHLRRRGTPVSQATLSYWQSGRSQPERARSLAALAQLEQLLGMEEGGLAAHLDAPKPRGRAVRRPTPVHRGPSWAPASDFARMVEGMDLSRDADLTRLSLHVRVDVGRDRSGYLERARQVLRAEKPGITGLVVLSWANEGGRSLPLRPVRNCTIGRVNVDDDTGQVATELRFDQVPEPQGTIVVEYEFMVASQGPDIDHFENMPRMPVREYLLEVGFHPEALPRHVVAFSDVDDTHRARAVALDTSHTAHMVAHNLTPGRYGMRWTWR